MLNWTFFYFSNKATLIVGLDIASTSSLIVSRGPYLEKEIFVRSAEIIIL